jgi:amino acid adenylation domain-containing protein
MTCPAVDRSEPDRFDVIARRIFDQAAATPDATAIWDGAPVSYREFAGRAARLAHLLRSWGVGPDTPVAVVLDRSADQLVAALAVLAAGGAYLPLEPSSPASRLTAVLERAQSPVAITSSGAAEVLAGTGLMIFEMDAQADLLAGLPDTPPAQSAGPDHLAYVIYTSGSTGRPKGAMNTRRGLANRLAWMQRAYELTAEDAVLQKTPVGFDVAVWECFAGPFAGARTVVARPDGHRDPRYLASLIREQRVTVAHFVPSMLRVFLDTADLRGCGSLRQVLAGGEALPAELQRRFFGSGLRAELDNVYGPAETAIDVTRWRCHREWPELRVPIGRPVRQTTAYVLDDRGAPVREGEPGELCLGGVQVGRGYLGEPALTAERFVPDPFSAEPGARLYHTGDQCRSRPDGALEFLGRLDDQVKLRGVRIELGEIEAVLAGQPGVRACAAAVRGTGANAKLIGYFVGDAVPRALRARLAELLPAPMAPSAMVPLAKMPLSANGKVDRARLPEPAVAAGTQAAAENDTERDLAAMWADLLEVPVGVDADFIELGGNSLHAVRIIARIRARYGAELSLHDFFAAGTVRGLGRLLGRGHDEGRATPRTPPVRRAAEPDLVPSLSQQRLWFIDHLSAAAGVAYNVPVASRLRGPLDRPALTAAVTDVVARHEQLRTAFVLDDGQVCARVRDDVPAVPLVDLEGHPEPELTALREAGRLAAAHMDLGAAPLMRCAVFRIAENDHLMLMVLHHIVADGWTVNIIDRDLAEAYAARTAGQRPPPRDHTLEYRDFARWQREFAESAALEPLLGHWHGQLADAPVVLDLPADHERPAVRSHRGRRITQRAPLPLAELYRLAAAAHATPYAACLAAYGLMLRELTGRSDFLVATPAAGRPAVELEQVAGFFANTVPVRLRPGDLAFRQLAADTHRTVLDALEHQYVPFERLVAAFAPARDLSRPPLAQVALAYQGRRRPYAELAGLTVEPAPVDTGTARFDFALEVHEVGDGLEVTAEYSTDLFTPERAGRMLHRFVELLTAAARDPDAHLGRVLTNAGPARRPTTGPRAPQERARRRCLHEAFADAAARWPDRVAVTDGATSLSYTELDRAANRLAHRLRGLGAAPERLIALCADRTVDAVVGVLGILKSGAGYLPLDPHHPAARLEQTLADAGCRVVLGHEEFCRPLTRDGRTLVPLGVPDGLDPADGLDAPPRVAVHPDATAYVIYTSGSTGLPKGVVVSHANAVRLFSVTEGEFGFGPDDVWTLFHSLAFDFSVWEIWGALLYGGKLVVVSHVTSREPAAYLDLLRTEQVTVLNQTPTAFLQLADAAEDADFPLLGLRLVIFGGEALEPSKLRRWVSGYGTARPALVNMYGITETTVHVTMRRISVDDLLRPASPIGRPIGDLRIYLLDASMAEVPCGTEGEIYVGGAGVSRGYLGRLARSAERFVPDPFGPPGGRLYQTGDRAVRLASGELEFRGRADAQVKLHGFRIELGEIEHALLAQPGIRAAVCVLREDTPGQPRLAAYLVPAAGHSVRSAQIRRALMERLPKYMVPAAFVDMPTLPLSSNGKLDRAGLPVPASHVGVTGAQPRTAAEGMLASVWSEVLGADQPGVDDNFFALGGDSILAIRVAAAARSAGIPVTVEHVFQHPTIAQLAKVCSAEQSGTTPFAEARLSGSLPDLDPADLPNGVIDAYPTGAMQLGILVDIDLMADPGVYRDLISARLAARFDRPALERALATVCDRHEIARTAFNSGKFREPMQLVYRSAEIPLTVQDAPADAGPRAFDDALRTWWEKEKTNPFDITRPPLIRCHVLRSPQTESFQLSLSVHHIVFDGWSLAQLMTELITDYDAQLDGFAAALAPMPQTRYRDFIAAERSAITDTAHSRFWSELIASYPDVSLPMLDTHDGNGEYAFRRAIPPETEADLRRMAAQLGIPLKSVYFAAHLWALHEITGNANVVSGLQVNGRLDRDGADRLLGVLLNVIPVPLKLDEGTWAELATAAFAAERRIQQFRRFPLAKMQRLAGRDRKLFEAVFNFTDFHVFDELRELSRVQVADWWFADRHSFPLVLGVSRSPRSGERVMDVTTGSDIRLAGTAARLGEVAFQTLADIANDPYAQRPWH